MFNEFIKWIVTFVCGGVVSFIGTLLAQGKQRRARNKAVEDGLQALLRAEIIRTYEKSDERGYCPLYSKEAIKREYDAYHALGGNDVATDLCKKIMALPTEPKE